MLYLDPGRLTEGGDECVGPRFVRAEDAELAEDEIGIRQRDVDVVDVGAMPTDQRRHPAEHSRLVGYAQLQG